MNENLLYKQNMRAVVDIGSNSVKFLAAKVHRNAIEALGSESMVTRLGRGLEKSGLLSQKSITDTVAALEKIKLSLVKLGVLDTTVVATSAVRDCKNAETISEPVQRIFSVVLRILSGQEEAFFSLKGAVAAANQLLGTEDCVFIDVGGASTEVSVQKPEFLAHSFQAGAVRCHERLNLPETKISDVEWKVAQEKIQEFFPLQEWKHLTSNFTKTRPVVAVGGTLVLAAKIAGAVIEKGCGIRITRSRLEELNENLRNLTVTERMALPGMEVGRADIICAGILVLTTLLNRLGAEDVLLTTWGLRHGILLSGSPSNSDQI